jgi:hypothetical protein
MKADLALSGRVALRHEMWRVDVLDLRVPAVLSMAGTACAAAVGEPVPAWSSNPGEIVARVEEGW